jgi:hypothetical protein
MDLSHLRRYGSPWAQVSAVYGRRWSMPNRQQVSRFAAILSLLVGLIFVPNVSLVSPAGAATDCARPTPSW